MLSRRTPRAPGALIALALAFVPPLASAGCDLHGDPLEILPEFDDVSSFESDLGRWSARTLDLGAPPVAYEVVRSSERALDGTQSVRLRVANQAGQPKVFLQRRYETEKDQTYTIDVTLGFASADSVGAAPWRLIVGAAPDSVRRMVDGDAPGLTSNNSAGSAGYVWSTRRYALEARSDADGELFLYVGVWATSPGTRTYYVDNVKVTLTRKGITTTK